MTSDYRDRRYNLSEDELRTMLFGRKIVNVQTDPMNPFIGTMTLDDGTVLEVGGNEGGCSCGAGDYPLETLNTVDNAITNVRIEERPSGDNDCAVCGKWDCEHQGFYRIFVVAEDHNEHLVASFEGSDGNGWYGTGWWISVVPT